MSTPASLYVRPPPPPTDSRFEHAISEVLVDLLIGIASSVVGDFWEKQWTREGLRNMVFRNEGFGGMEAEAPSKSRAVATELVVMASGE